MRLLTFLKILQKNTKIHIKTLKLLYGLAPMKYTYMGQVQTSHHSGVKLLSQ